MNKEEILKLHELSEEDAIGWLYDRGVFKNRKESMADCAFRMRDDSDRERWWSEICTVSEIMENRVVCDKCGHRKQTNSWNWVEDAKPIHWIQAALLANLESEGE